MLPWGFGSEGAGRQVGEGQGEGKMAAYVIADIEVAEPATVREYRNRVGATVEPDGGKFVVRGGRVNPTEGDWQPHLVVMLEFPASSRPSAGTTLRNTSR